MKRSGNIVIIMLFVLVLSVLVFAKTGCKYDPKFDKDKDYIMNDAASCGSDYAYDCDDNDKDVYKGCHSWLWQKILDLFSKKTDSTKISGTAVAAVSKTDETEKVCAANICTKSNTEIYCTEDIDSCKEKYGECRIVKCDVEKTVPTSVKTQNKSAKGVCTSEYNDCYDRGEAVTCKGTFTACCDSFDNCICGTEEVKDSSLETAVPDFDATENVSCDTGIFICERQSMTIDGNLAKSVVTCKSSFTECAMMYGSCRCGNATLTTVPAKYIGDTGMARPIGMDNGKCTKKKHRCDKGNGVMITCDGSFDYCNKRYNNLCRCGIDQATSGFMVTSSD